MNDTTKDVGKNRQLHSKGVCGNTHVRYSGRFLPGTRYQQKYRIVTKYRDIAQP